MNNTKLTRITTASNISSIIRKAASMALCLALLFSSACSAKVKENDEKTVPADEAFFTSETLDLSSAIDGEYAGIEAVKQFRDGIGILLFGTSQYFIQRYDNNGQLVSQTALESALDPNANLIDMADDADGNLLVLTQYMRDTTEEFVSELYTFDSKGLIVGAPLEITNLDSVSETTMEVDNQGNIYLYYSSNETCVRGIAVFNSDGIQLYDILETNGLNYGDFLKMDGQMYTVGNDYSSGATVIGLYPIDNAKEKLGNPIDITAALGIDAGSLNVSKAGLYSSNDKGVYSVNINKQKIKTVFLWKNTDFTKSHGDQVIVLSDTATIVVKKSESDGSSIVSVSFLTRSAVNPDAGKKIISIAGSAISLDSTVLTAVHEFNMNSKEYRIEIHEYYGNPQVSNNTTSVVSAMNLEILSGDAPDIIYGDIQLFANCEKRGLLTDLYSMMENDSVFNKDDVIPSILKICETDGHLYKLGTGFQLKGFVGAKSIIGDRTGWTVDEFNRLAESLPDKMTPLIGYSQSELLDLSLSANMDSFVDFKTGTIRFDSDDFRSLLNYAKTYGEPDSDTDAIWPNRSEMIANGELAMYSTCINSPTSYANDVLTFGEPVSVTGYPSSESSTASCYMGTMLAIYSGSDNKEAAWEFLKYFFTEEAQKALESKYQSPVLTSVFEEQIEKALNLDPNVGGSMLFDISGYPTQISAEMAEGYRDLIYGMNSLGSYDYEIRDIVLEEAAPYFYDQKSADDVIALIQNRVQTLVDERQ